jgi:hypothetical protein
MGGQRSCTNRAAPPQDAGMVLDDASGAASLGAAVSMTSAWFNTRKPSGGMSSSMSSRSGFHTYCAAQRRQLTMCRLGSRQALPSASWPTLM